MLKRLQTILLVLLAIVVPVGAQEIDPQTESAEKEFVPHWFVGAQGGVQNTFCKGIGNWKTFTPTASVNLGYWATPECGLRIGLNGAWNKAGVSFYNHQPAQYYRYNYLTPSADVLVNLCTLFGRKEVYPANLIFIGGLGANYAFETRDRAEAVGALPFAKLPGADNDSRWAFNGRLGLMLDVPLCKHWSVNLEADLNNIWMNQLEAFNRDRLQLTLQLGFAYKFAYKKEEKAEDPELVMEPEPEPEPEVWETRIDSTWQDMVTYADVSRDRNIKREIFFNLRESAVSDTDAQIQAIAEFLKSVPDAKVSITAYADRETGNPRINMRYSELRAQNTKKALIKLGVDPKILKSVSWRGDTEQPYAENDKNRVAIISGHGTYAEQEPQTHKELVTNVVRYRVK